MELVQRLSTILTILLVPVVLILIAVMITLTPLFIQVEYRLPGFPEDRYGFNFDERLYWANISRQYLLNDEDIDFLADQQLDENTPLYNERELRHMVDVKNVVRGAIVVLSVSLFVESLLGYWAKRSNRWSHFQKAISNGGWLTVGMIATVLVYLGLNFNSLFTNFHLIFFDGDTWLFRYSDSLIRLFPIRFWRDAFIWVATVALASGAILGYYFTRVKGRVFGSG